MFLHCAWSLKHAHNLVPLGSMKHESYPAPSARSMMNHALSFFRTRGENGLPHSSRVGMSATDQLSWSPLSLPSMEGAKNVRGSLFTARFIFRRAMTRLPRRSGSVSGCSCAMHPRLHRLDDRHTDTRGRQERGRGSAALLSSRRCVGTRYKHTGLGTGGTTTPLCSFLRKNRERSILLV